MTLYSPLYSPLCSPLYSTLCPPLDSTLYWILYSPPYSPLYSPLYSTLATRLSVRFSFCLSTRLSGQMRGDSRWERFGAVHSVPVGRQQARLGLAYTRYSFVDSGSVHESILVLALNLSSLPPFVMFSRYWAIYGFPPSPLFAIQHTQLVLVLPISCKGQGWVRVGCAVGCMDGSQVRGERE